MDAPSILDGIAHHVKMKNAVIIRTETKEQRCAVKALENTLFLINKLYCII